MDFIFLHQSISANDVLNFLERLSGLISGLIIILVFYLERRGGKKDRIKESFVNWYLKVLVDRNLEKIDSFFLSIEKIFLSELKSSQSNLFSNENDLIFDLKLSFIEKFDHLKEDFKIQFLTLVSSLDSELYSTCVDKINEVEDNVKTHIDSTFSGIDSEFNRLKISQLKSEFYSILYKPIERIHSK